MTEEEARTRMCPYAATFAGSQQIADGPGPNCIGSQCMAWRHDGHQKMSRYLTVGGEIPDGWERPIGVINSPVEKDGVDCWLIVTKSSFPHGYCGLAGVPK